MDTMEERLTRAGENLFSGEREDALRDMPVWNRLRHDYIARARQIIIAAFPELFDGTAWLAPMVMSAPDRLRGMMAMRAALDSAEPPSFSEAFREGFEAMRDLHLNASASPSPAPAPTGDEKA